MFKKAERKESKLRLGLIGPSGSGKTYSALLIAQGLGGKIAMLDSERGSGSLYSDLIDYDIAEISPPFSPARYVQGINEAGQAGYDILIIDSLSHAWSGQGGILEEVDKRKASQKNQFAAWRDVTPMHNAMVDAILASPLHVIVTMRSKTAWELQKDEQTGKTKPVKIGLAPVQRDGLEYEFSCVLELSVEKHVCTASKDRTGLFDGKYFVPGVETGQTLSAWLSGSKPENDKGKEQPVTQKPEPTPAPKKAMAATRCGTTVIDLFNALRQLGLGDKVDAYESHLAGKYGHGARDLTPEQIQEQYFNLGRCKHDKELFQRFVNYLDGLKKAA